MIGRNHIAQIALMPYLASTPLSHHPSQIAMLLFLVAGVCHANATAGPKNRRLFPEKTRCKQLI